MKPVQEQVQKQQQQQNQVCRALSARTTVARSSESVTSADTRPGKFPKMTTTLRADVLATMLAQDDMTGMASVFSIGSTKLATVMRALTRRYRWPIERREFATNTADRRVAWVSMYSLPAETIASAFAVGAETWIEEVRAARSKRLSAPTRRSVTSPLGSNTNEQAYWLGDRGED